MVGVSSRGSASDAAASPALRRHRQPFRRLLGPARPLPSTPLPLHGHRLPGLYWLVYRLEFQYTGTGPWPEYGRFRIVDLWKDLVDHPEKWWDNRSNKFNPKSPDFKHKETGDGLWLGRTIPQDIISKLPPLDSKATDRKKAPRVVATLLS